MPAESSFSQRANCPSFLSPAWLRWFRRRLVAWYERSQRDLPWRRTRDPYQIWVSEIMLQQTQVDAAIPYFARFVASYPTLGSLAQADEQSVLRLWEGLGYYRRARQLHRAAGLCLERHGGQVPRSQAALRALPGIGRYTAGAILSIAFDAPEPVLEANTLRLYTRLAAYQGDVHRAAGQRRMWQMAAALVPRRGAGRLNQALMELGATVCLPRSPRCGNCPVAELCRGRATGLAGRLPRPKPKPASEAVAEAALVLKRGRAVLLYRRGDQGRWAGMWDFPRFAVAARGGAALRRALAANTRELTGVCAGPLEPLAVLKHGVTRFRITLHAFQAIAVPRSRRSAATVETRWVPLDQLEKYPLCTTARKLARLAAGKA